MRRFTPAQSTLLDSIRGLSAVAVMVGHGLTMLPEPPLVGTRYPIQSYGVILFFVLSGFLIAYNCMVKPRYSFNEYMVDRFARIFTAFVPAILLVAVADPLYRTVGEANSIGTFTANLLMLHHTPFDRMIAGLGRFEPFGSARQFWTIAVEWWLYTLFGIAFFLQASSLRERAGMALLFAPALLVVLFFATQESIAQVWIAAAMAAVAFCRFTPSVRTYGLSFVATAFFAFALYQRFLILDLDQYLNFYDVNFMFLTTGLFVSLVSLAAESRALAWALDRSAPFWRWLSWISYSLYLTHQTLHYAWNAKLGVLGWPSFLVLCALSVAFAWLFTWAFDRHHKSVARALKAALGRVRVRTDGTPEARSSELW